MVFLLLLALAGTTMAATIPTPTGMWFTVKGRQVKLEWTRVEVSGSVVDYDIYRDDVKLATVIDGQKDPETDGQVWYSNALYQYYNDNTAWPGKTHTYTVIAKVGVDSANPITRNYAVPVPSFTGTWISYKGGRTVRLEWTHLTADFGDMKYQIFRDDVKIAEFQQRTSGEDANGNTWINDTSYQNFYDNNAFPGETHNYKIVAVLFEGSDAVVEFTKSYAVPIPAFTSVWASYRSGRTVGLEWSHINAGFADMKYQIFRDDVKIAEFQQKSSGESANGDTWVTNTSYQSFYDNNTFPGQTHKYKIVAVLFEGCEAIAQVEKSVPIPLPAFTNTGFTYQNGRNVRIHWLHIPNWFTNITYHVYRDNQKIADFTSKTQGTGVNGDTWSFDGGYQYYTDATAYPGKNHAYKIVATLFPGFEIAFEQSYTVPSTSFDSVSIIYSGVRTVQFYWRRIASPDFNVVYTVYRDGEALASFNADATGSAENGNSWKLHSSYQYFYDANAWPGKVHQYKVVAQLFPGCELSVEKEFQVPHTILPAPVFTYQSGRNVQLHWAKIVSHPTFDTIQYTVFRDGVELASFTADTEGSGTNNDSWKSAGNHQYYVDGTAIPWQTHQYRVEARLFEDCTVARESNYTVPGPKVTSPWPTVMSVNSVSLSLGYNWANSFADASLEIYRNGQKIDTLTPTNNAFPTTYLDTGINVPDGPHYYQFLFRLYPGCDSGMSAQFPLTVPTPQVPKLVLVKNEIGAVTLRLTGANIKTPQKYEIYKDGFLLATTGTGTTVDYVDTSYGSGKLVKYEAQTRFDQFPSSYVSAKSIPIYVVKMLKPDELMSVVTPYDSDVSPAWVDGDSNVAYIPIELSVDNVRKGNVQYYSDKSWYADAVGEPGKPRGIPLNPDAPTSLILTARPDVTIGHSYELTWTPTDLHGRTTNEPALHIRKGDSLLLTATGTGTLLEIDADGDGVYELSGIPGQKFPVAFNTSDIVTVNARIDGTAVGSMNVAVAAVSQAPEVCYLRTLSASANNYVAIDFETSPSLFPDLGVYIPESAEIRISSGGGSVTRRQYNLPTTRDSYIETSFMTRLRHHRGPALSHTKIRVIMVSIDGRSYSPVLERYADGTCLYGNCISMVEKFPALSMKVTLTNAGVIFADTGTTVKVVKAEEFDENGQANLYILSKPTGTSAGYGIIAEMLIDEN